MGEYGQVLWLPVAAGLTVIGILISLARWRRRGAGSGLRGLAWALLPIGCYLTGLLGLLVPFAFKVAGWAAGLVFNLASWLGIAVLGLAVVLWVVSGVIIGRRQASGTAKDRSVGSGTGGASGSGRGAVGPARTSATSTGSGATTAPLPATRSQAPAGKGGSQDQDDDMQDIEEILKRRGIT